MSQLYKSALSGPIPPSIPTQFTTDDGAHVIPLANNLNVFGGVGATTTGDVGTGTVTVNVKTDSFTWSDQAVSFNAAVQNGYFCTAALTVTLPTASLVNGATIIIYVDTASPVVIQAGASQFIEISNSTTSMGGTATSTAQGNIVTLVFRVSDSTWHTISSQGSWSLV